MNKAEAIEVLTYANRWRRDDDGGEEMPDVRELGWAIDFAVKFMKDDEWYNEQVV
jgi:hypothetical protein